MKRRRPLDYGAVPERLLRFVASDWPGMPPREAFSEWHEQRRAVVLANRNTALGNLVEELRGALAERRRVWGALYGVAHHLDNRTTSSRSNTTGDITTNEETS